MKTKLGVIITLTVFCMAMSTVCFADVSGGWDEESGYFESTTDYEKTMLMDSASLSTKMMAARSSVKHTGKREDKVISGTTNFRSHGWTTWVGVYHYTRAQMTATWDASDVFKDSGRQWGNDGTEAISPWLKFNPDNDNGIARTFYGN